MTRRDPRVFSYSEANEVVRDVAELTSIAVERLQEIRQRYEGDSAGEPVQMPGWAVDAITITLLEWSKRVAALGAFPKGYFTVDFQSANPELLYCWTYGEDKITHTHSIWENFSDRRPLDAPETSMDHLKWVN